MPRRSTAAKTDPPARFAVYHGEGERPLEPVHEVTTVDVVQPVDELGRGACIRRAATLRGARRSLRGLVIEGVRGQRRAVGQRAAKQNHAVSSSVHERRHPVALVRDGPPRRRRATRRRPVSRRRRPRNAWNPPRTRLGARGTPRTSRWCPARARRRGRAARARERRVELHGTPAVAVVRRVGVTHLVRRAQHPAEQHDGGSSPYSGDSSIASEAAVSGTARGVSVSINIFPRRATPGWRKSDSGRRLPGSPSASGMTATRSRQCAAAARRRVPHDRGVRMRARGTLARARVARNPEDDVALFGKRDSTDSSCFIRPKVDYFLHPRVNSLRFRILASFRFLATDFELSDSLRRFPKRQKPRSDFVSRVPTARDYCLCEEREVRCFSPFV